MNEEIYFTFASSWKFFLPLIKKSSYFLYNLSYLFLYIIKYKQVYVINIGTHLTMRWMKTINNFLVQVSSSLKLNFHYLSN